MFSLSLSVPLGSTPELPADSCKEIKASEGAGAVSGNYWLDSARSGNALIARCDMKTESKWRDILRRPFSNSYRGMLRGQIHTNLPLDHPIITIWNNTIQDGQRISNKLKVHCKFAHSNSVIVFCSRWLLRQTSVFKQKRVREYSSQL